MGWLGLWVGICYFLRGLSGVIVEVGDIGWIFLYGCGIGDIRMVGGFCVSFLYYGGVY